MTMTDDVGHALGKIREYLTMHVDMMNCTIDIGTGLYLLIFYMFIDLPNTTLTRNSS